MKKFLAILAACFFITAATTNLFACGDMKAQAQTEAAVAAQVSHNVCPTTGKACPADCKACPASGKACHAAGVNHAHGGMQVIAAGHVVKGSSCSAGGKECNMSSVMAAMAAGLLLVFGAVSLMGKMKI